ncbi:family S53 protease-like protein [Lentinula raphanica]|nr:family S53 protease-like protein [Lentinula raphanica]
MAASVSSRRAMTIHDQRELPDYFAHAGAPDPDTPLSLRIALTPNDLPTLESRFWDVSTPGNPLYGQHLSYDETKALASPSPDTVSAVAAWLNENDINNFTTSGAFNDWLLFTVPISTVNSLFNADYQIFNKTGDSGTQIMRTLVYSIPTDLQKHINLIYPSTDFVGTIAGPQYYVHTGINSVASTLSFNNTPEAQSWELDSIPCDAAMYPACLQKLYGIPTNATQGSTTLGVTGFIGQYAQEADLRSFLYLFRQDIPLSTTFTLQTLDGGSNPQDILQAGIEANLDIQYTIGLATGVPTTFISVGKQNTDGLSGFLDVINAMNSKTVPPSVLTTSYGFNENAITFKMADQLCKAYMTLGSRGVSVLFASGDGGVSGAQSQDNCGPTFIPTFPSSCPFVTSVGATQLNSECKETSAQFSSGGFSNYFTRSSYQNASVAKYLSDLGNTYASEFSANGHGFPDVAAQGSKVEIITRELSTLVYGTSCSSPIFASVVALINDRLITSGKSQLGFLNPFLYNNSHAFHDIASGSNPGCGTSGFPANAGWDPVTGLGTPNYAALLDAALSQ